MAIHAMGWISGFSGSSHSVRNTGMKSISGLSRASSAYQCELIGELILVERLETGEDAHVG
jgi:hypothetical protein